MSNENPSTDKVGPPQTSTPETTGTKATERTTIEPEPRESAMNDLQEVIREGHRRLEAEQEKFVARWDEHTQHTGPIELDSIGQDADIKELVNTAGGNPLFQIMLLNWQMTRTMKRIEVMLQGIGAFLANQSAPETEKAVKAVAKETG